MEKLNAHNRENGRHDLGMWIGIHTGEAVLGDIGSEKKTRPYGDVYAKVVEAGEGARLHMTTGELKQTV